MAEGSGKLVQPAANTILDKRQTLLIPGLVAFQQSGGCKCKDRRLHRIDRSKHPGNRACPRIGVVWHQAGMTLRDMEDDRPCLEEREPPFLIGRNLAERM